MKSPLIFIRIYVHNTYLHLLHIIKAQLKVAVNQCVQLMVRISVYYTVQIYFVLNEIFLLYVCASHIFFTERDCFCLSY